MKNFKLVLALLVSLGVAACGGGGDSSVSSSNVPLYIDSTNVQTVAATAIRTASGSTFELFNPDNFATEIYDALFYNAPRTIPCISGNGSIDLTSTTGIITYNNCVISTTPVKTLNGSVHVYNSSLDSLTGGVLATLSFNSLSVSNGSVTRTLNGNYDLTADGENTPTPKLRAKETTFPNGFPEKLILTNNAGQQEILSSFNFYVDVISNSTTTYTSKFKLASDDLGGSITHQSALGFPYERSSPNAKPGLGKAYVFGQNPTELGITVFGNENSLPQASQVQVDRSIDNGFWYPFTSYYPWSQL
jgi:hypothetical protein